MTDVPLWTILADCDVTLIGRRKRGETVKTHAQVVGIVTLAHARGVLCSMTDMA